MNVFRRIEVWILLLLAAGLAIWMGGGAGSSGSAPLPPEWSQTPVDEKALGLELLGVTLERDYGNARLDLKLRVRNPDPRPLPLRPPEVKLLGGTDLTREVQPFYLPAELPPDVGAGVTAEVVLRFWLEAEDLLAPLLLAIGETGIEVKSAAPVELDSLPNGGAIEWQQLDWSGMRDAAAAK